MASHGILHQTSTCLLPCLMYSVFSHLISLDNTWVTLTNHNTTCGFLLFLLQDFFVVLYICNIVASNVTNHNVTYILYNIITHAWLFKNKIHIPWKKNKLYIYIKNCKFIKIYYYLIFSLNFLLILFRPWFLRSQNTMNIHFRPLD